MSLDSFKRSPPEDGSASLRPKEGFQGTQTPDVFKFAQEYQAAKEISSRAELMSVLRDILDTREAGQCLRTGKWYVESATDGVWLSPIELAGKPDRPKSFLAYSKLDDFFTDAAVPSIVADAVDPNHQAAEAGKTVGKTIGESLVAKEKAETEKKAVALADILAQNPFTSNFHSFGDFVSSNANDFHATVRSGNLAFDGHPSRTDLVKKVQAVLPEYSDPHGKIHEEKREKLVSGEWVKETTRSLDRTIAKYEAMPWNHGRMTELFMNLRLGLSQDADAPPIGLQDGESLRRVIDLADYLGDSNYSGTKPNLLDAPWDVINVVRYSASFSTQEAIALLRDGTSGMLHKIWPEDAPYERIARNAIVWPDGKKPEGTIEGIAFEISRFPTAVAAGGIDGALEVVQSWVDLAFVPDKIAGNIASLGQVLWNDSPAVLDAISKSIDGSADRAYICSYIAAVLFVSVELWPLGLIPAMRSIQALLARAWVDPETIAKISEGLQPVVQKAQALSEQAKRLNPIPEDKLPNAATVRKLWKEAFGRSDDLNTVRGTASKGAEAAEEQARKTTSETLGQLASATVVADTFATKILTELNGEGSIKDKAGLAIDLCLKDFSKNEKFVQANLSELKKGASTVLTYRLTLLEEKTNEVREVFEKEAIPLSVGYLDALSQKLENPNALTEFLGKVELHYSSAPTNPITEELIKLLKKPERSTQ